MTRTSLTKPWLQALIVLLMGTIYWGVAAAVFVVEEPWDTPLYWTVLYPVSLGLAAAFGARSSWRPEIIGLGLTFPQVLIMAVAHPTSPTLMVGIGFAAALSIPAVLAAWLAAKIVRPR